MTAIEHDQNALVKEVSPAEAAHLIDELERGYQAAYRAARDAYGTPGYQPRRAMAGELDQLAGDEHWATFATGLRHPAESIPQFLNRTQAEAEAAAAQSMTCPECGEDARERPPADRVNWQAHGLEQPAWSHRDGSSLCPVMGTSGYQPARPQPAQPARDRDADIARPGPPATMRPAGNRGPAACDGQAGQRGTIPRQYLADTIRRPDVTGPGPVLRGHDRAPARQAEREAGE